VRLLSDRHEVDDLRIERLVGDVWTHVALVHPKSEKMETVYECIEEATTTTTTTTGIPPATPFTQIGMNRACRGANSSDNSPSYYYVKVAQTLEDCQARCLEEVHCQGIEFRPGRCEVWVREIQATASVSGFQCLRYVEPMTRGFIPAEGGVDRACRGAGGNNAPSNYRIASASSLRECQDLCLNQECQGIEYSRGRCELWQAIGATASVAGFRCLHLLRGYEAVDGPDRACRGATSSDNSPGHYQ
ncbi:eglS, partial [Symbiodinium pilosum]